jgi:hypothetical protein
LVVLAALVAVVVAAACVGHTDAKPRPRPPNRFGIAAGGLLQTLPRRDLARDLDGVDAVGATWVRIDVNWAVIQARGPRSYQWSPFDRTVRAALARGLSVLGVIVYSPGWAHPEGGSGSAPPTNLRAYASFARAAARHFRPLGVHAYEIWNEPNIGEAWSPAPDPARYTQMLRLAYAAIKAADPRAKVISGGLAPYGPYGAADATHMSPLDFLERMYQNGARGSLDAVGWHPYNFPAGLGFSPTSAWSQMVSTTPSARGIMRANGDAGKRIWATEFGAPTGASTRALSEPAQAALVKDAYTKLKAWRWAGPAFLYNFRDSGGLEPGAPAGGGFGLVRVDWSKKPSYAAYAQVARAR